MIPVHVTLQYIKQGHKESTWVMLSLADTVQTTITNLVKQLELPTRDANQHEIVYRLMQQRQYLADTVLLADVGVQEGDILQLLTVDFQATMNTGIGSDLVGNLLDRLGKRSSGTELPIHAALTDMEGRILFQIKHTRALIGRADSKHGYPPESLDADLTKLDARRSVSRPHGLLVYKDGKFSIRDLYSQQGIYVNGEKIPASMSYDLVNGDVLKFGDIEMRLFWE